MYRRANVMISQNGKLDLVKTMMLSENNTVKYMKSVTSSSVN